LAGPVALRACRTDPASLLRVEESCHWREDARVIDSAGSRGSGWEEDEADLRPSQPEVLNLIAFGFSLVTLALHLSLNFFL
jgi:hypothetical protein